MRLSFSCPHIRMLTVKEVSIYNIGCPKINRSTPHDMH